MIEVLIRDYCELNGISISEEDDLMISGEIDKV